MYFGDQGGTEYSLNVANGHENWHFDTGGPIKAGADYYDGDLFFGNYAGSFYAVNAKTGKQVWSESPGGEFYSTPAVAFGLVYTGNNDGTVYAYRRQGRNRGLDTPDGLIRLRRPRGGRRHRASARRSTSAPTTATSTRSTPRPAPRAGTSRSRPRATMPSPGRPRSSTTPCTSRPCTTRVRWGLNTRTGKQVFYSPDGGYTSAVADPKAVFLIGKYNFYKCPAALRPADWSPWV